MGGPWDCTGPVPVNPTLLTYVTSKHFAHGHRWIVGLFQHGGCEPLEGWAIAVMLISRCLAPTNKLSKMSKD